MFPKFTPLSIIGVLLLASCSNFYTYNEYRNKASITDIPLRQVKDKVDLYFNSERPAQPFYKIKIIEVTGASDAGYNEMLTLLQQKALIEGMDGIIFLDLKQQTGYSDISESVYLKDTTTSISRQVASPYQRMAGIGLKYAASINYLDTIVRKQKVVQYKNNQPSDSFTVFFDWHGVVVKDPDAPGFQQYYQQVLPFDVMNAYTAWGRGWSVYLEPATEQIVSKRYELNLDDNIRFDYNYNIYGEIDHVIIRHHLFANSSSPGIVHLNFDRYHLLNEKRLVSKKKVLWRERFVYDDKNRCVKIIRTAGNTDTILLTIENEFFSNNDLPVAEK